MPNMQLNDWIDLQTYVPQMPSEQRILYYVHTVNIGKTLELHSVRKYSKQQFTPYFNPP